MQGQSAQKLAPHDLIQLLSKWMHIDNIFVSKFIKLNFGISEVKFSSYLEQLIFLKAEFF
jgi:hypothetical protein